MKNEMQGDRALRANAEGWVRMFKHFHSRGSGIRRYPMDTVVGWTLSYARTDLPFKRVMDLGCGGSPNLFFFIDEGFEYHGLDVTDTAFRDLSGLSEAARAKVNFKVADLPNLPYDDGYFSHVVSTEALHLNASEESMRRAISECYRVLAPKGRMLATTFAPDHWFVRDGNVDWVGEHVIRVNQTCVERSRSGIYYYIYPDEDQIKEMFGEFSSCVVGRQGWFFGEQPGQEVSHYVISATK